MIPARPALTVDAPLQGRDMWLLLGSLSGANLVATFSATAPVASILPVITASMRTDLATVTWMLTIYQLASAGLVLTFGRLADLRGLRLVYAWGCVVLTLGSLACALAPDIGALIAARALSGVGAAMVFSTSPAIVSRYSPSERRGTMLGLLLTVSTFGMALGPFLAGLITDALGWRWVFLLGVPILLLVFAPTVAVVPRDPPPRAGRFDLAGAATFLVGVTALLLALNQGGSWGWLSPPTVGFAVVGVAVLGLFVQVERRFPSPMLDLGLFRNRTFAAASLSASLNYIATSSLLVLVPLYLIGGRGLAPTQAGLYLVTQPLMRTLVGPFSGMLADRLGPRLPSSAGMAFYAAGLLLMARLGPASDYTEVVAALLVAGVGAGLFLSPNTVAILGAAGRHQQGVASGVVSTARNLGVSFGVVVAAAVVSASTGGQSEPAPELLYAGVRAAFATAAVCAGIGVIASLVREPAPPDAS